MKRWLAPITVAVAALLAAGAGPAVAAPATPTPVDQTPFPIACPTFNLQAQLSGKGGTIVLPGNRTTFTGPNLRITLTGPTGKTVTYVITGATHVTTLPDGSLDVTATGRNTIIVPNANGHPAGLFLTTGTMHWTLNPDLTERTLFSGKGTVTDVCKLLA
ncbi:hypothetical protein SAMN04487916_102234 [Arthrobacter sp. ov407]|uniref:hypothetical protein n=1 Tax=Arthrobacter sp. ov407 TaxID=1761748 RepID=UPI00087F5244|nr:hypothetical protein [Arthrobacter sp. ov407]SDK70733.1 hypothetical protein SAMN04487916_102234 [Arthrobacter sp. ov407]